MDMRNAQMRATCMCVGMCGHAPRCQCVTSALCRDRVMVFSRCVQVLLPCLVRAATTVMLLTAADGSLSAVAILLNILAITFVCEMDEMISAIFVKCVACIPTHAAHASQRSQSSSQGVQSPSQLPISEG